MEYVKRIFLLGIITTMLLVTIGIALASGTNAGEKTSVIIGFKDKPDPALVKGLGGEIKHTYHIIPAIAAKIPPQVVDALSKSPKIAYVEEDGIVHAVDAELDNSWGVKRIGAGVVHAYNKGTGVNISIIDTGIDYNHDDLDANYKGGYDYVNGDADPMDDNGHGTHCAGIAAAEDNDIGVVGAAPEAHLYAVKVLDSGGSGYISDAVAGIQWAVDNHMQVISMSLGTSFDSQSLHDACDAAYNSGIVLVAAAGNEGNPAGKGDNVIYPARYSSVIAVAATDSKDKRAWWSSTGPDVELAAPGVSIYSTYLGGGYTKMSGTSMACPHVTGTAALVLVSDETVWASLGYTNGDGIWTNVEVRTVLDKTADDLGATGLDWQYGYGLVDADEAAVESIDVHDVAVTDVVAPSWVVVGDSVSVNVTVANEGTYDETFTVTLTDTTYSVEIGSESVTLTAGASTTLTFSWDTTGAMTGDHVLEATVSVVEGETDTADNSKTTTVTVKEPSHDVAVTAVNAPSEVGQGDVVDVNVDVVNEGTYDETFTVTLTDTTDGVGIGSEAITLAAGDSKTITFNWDTSSSTLGDHILKAEASIVEGETDTADNSKTATITVVEKTALSVSVTTDKTTYTMGEWVYITVTVTDNDGTPVEDAYVYIELTTASGRQYAGDGTTGSDGKAMFRFKTKKPDDIGTYSVTATASKSGYESGSGSTTFEVT